MPSLVSDGIRLAGLAAAVPSTKEDNAELSSLNEKQRAEIVNQVGIRFRHVANESVTASDLCATAARQLLQKLDWNINEIGLLVFVSQTPDHLVPGSATQLQHRLGLPQHCISIDVNQGCAGYVYGMSITSGMMKTYGIKKAMLLVGDTITKMVSRSDHSIWPIFADAGSATAFQLEPNAGSMTFKFGSKGEDFQAIHVPDGGFRNLISEKSLVSTFVSDGVSRQANQLSMNGQAVFTFGLSTVASSIVEMLKEETLSASDFDYLVLHQANQLLNDSIVRKTGFTKDQAPSSLHDFGNTSCATIPVTLVSQLMEQLTTQKLKLLLSGFGVGLSWGNVILETEKVTVLPMIYL